MKTKLFLTLTAIMLVLSTSCSEYKQVQKKNDCFHKPYKEKTIPKRTENRFTPLFKKADSVFFASESVVVVQGIELDLNKINDYKQGFNEGWEDGYCYKERYCNAPAPPPCPKPNVNEDKGYKGGYLRGFTLGKKKRDSERN